MSKVIKNKKTLICVYKALCESILRYGLTSWGTATPSNLLRVKRLQTALLRIIHNTRSTTNTNLFELYKVLPVEYLYTELMVTNHYYDSKYKINSTRVHEGRSTATYKRFIEPTFNNNHGKRELCFTIPLIFNQLPETMFNIEGIGKVKARVRQWLLDNINSLPNTIIIN